VKRIDWWLASTPRAKLDKKRLGIFPFMLAYLR